MAKKEIKTIKTIAKLGKRELRYTEIDGEKKYDIREWKKDKPHDGVRFSNEELLEVYNAVKLNKLNVPVGNKTLVFDDEYALSMVHNGRTYVRPFATKNELEKLIDVLSSVDIKADGLLGYDETKIEEIKEKEANEYISKRRGRPKKIESDTNSEQKTKIAPIKNKSRKEKTYTDAYEKFKDMFAKYRSKQDENRRKGYALTHKIITDHIKDIIETSPEYNANLMQEHKNSHKMMLYIQDKAFENAECLMGMATMEDANMYLCQWVDEYAGLDDAPKAKKEA